MHGTDLTADGAPTTQTQTEVAFLISPTSVSLRNSTLTGQFSGAV